MESTLVSVLEHAEQSRKRDLDNLFSLLMQASISAENIGVEDCAELEIRLLEESGLSTRLIETDRHPMVYGERLDAPGKPTVLIYGHYDVQPPDPLDEWISEPFVPTIRDGRIYARGAGDNKGQHFANICGVRAWLDETESLPVNVKILLEGEEETGSPHLEQVVMENRELLAADFVYTSDGPVQNDDFPQINYGVRGVLSIELKVRGASADLHSGNWGGIAPNAAWMLVHLLGTMMSSENRVTIDGFYDDVAPLTDAAKGALAQIPLDQKAVLASIGLEELPPPADASFYDRLTALPTMTINGLTSGYQGAGMKTVLPSTASAKMDMRLVPNQRADDIYDKVVSHIRRVAPEVEVTRHGSMEPSHTPLDDPFSQPIRDALATGFGIAPLEMPLLGGSLPDAVWTQTLGVPSFVVPYAQSDERNHAPNESIDVERFYAGIRTMAALIGELASLDGQQ